jgi:hypothetical protein
MGSERISDAILQRLENLRAGNERSMSFLEMKCKVIRLKLLRLRGDVFRIDESRTGRVQSKDLRTGGDRSAVGPRTHKQVSWRMSHRWLARLR